MPSMEQTVALRQPRSRDERGTSLVEFTLIFLLLTTLLLGIVIFGVLLSKRQVLTQASAEGARDAVPVAYTAANPGNALVAARDKTNRSLEGVGDRQCPTGTVSNGMVMVGTGIRCTFTVFDCDSFPRALTTANKDCIEVKVELDVKTNPSLVPGSSLISPLLPDTMTGRSIVGLSGATG